MASRSARGGFDRGLAGGGGHQTQAQRVDPRGSRPHVRRLPRSSRRRGPGRGRRPRRGRRSMRTVSRERLPRNPSRRTLPFVSEHPLVDPEIDRRGEEETLDLPRGFSRPAPGSARRGCARGPRAGPPGRAIRILGDDCSSPETAPGADRGRRLRRLLDRRSDRGSRSFRGEGGEQAEPPRGPRLRHREDARRSCAGRRRRGRHALPEAPRQGFAHQIVDFARRREADSAILMGGRSRQPVGRHAQEQDHGWMPVSGHGMCGRRRRWRGAARGRRPRGR